MSFLDLIDIEWALKHSIPYWQRYTTGVNMTVFDCDSVQSCVWKLEENNLLTTIVTNDDFFHYRGIDENNSYFASLGVPIMQIIAQKLNKIIYLKNRVHLYVFNENTSTLSFVQNNKIDSIDNTPNNYWEMSNESNITCVRPLLISNQMSILTAITKQSRYNSLFILQTYSFDVWLTLLATIFILSLISSINVSQNKDTIKKLIVRNLNIIWILFGDLVGKGDRKTLFTISYLFWLISIIPILEILRNQLVSNIVRVPERMIDNIDDLLDDSIMTFVLNKNDFQMIEEESHGKDNLLSEKLIKLRDKTKILSKDNTNSVYFSPKKLKRFVESMAILEDEFSMQWLYGTFQRHIKVDIGSQSYFPVLITPICFGPHFKDIQLANNISMVLYETGILNHWSQSKVNYVMTSYIKVFKLVKDSSPDSVSAISAIMKKDQIYDEDKAVSLSDTLSLFILFSYLTLICNLVMLSELVIPHLFQKYLTYLKIRDSNLNHHFMLHKRYSLTQFRNHMLEKKSFKFKTYSYC